MIFSFKCNSERLAHRNLIAHAPLEAAVLAKVAIVRERAQHAHVRLLLDPSRLKAGVARLDKVVHAEVVDAKRVPLLLRKLSLAHQRVRQTWFLQKLGGTRSRLEVAATRLDEVGAAQVGDTQNVQVFLLENSSEIDQKPPQPGAFHAHIKVA